MDAHPPGIGDWSTYREILNDQLRRAAPEQPVHAHRVGGSDGEPVRSVMVDAEDLVRSLHRSAQEAATKALQAPSVTTGAVAFDKMQADAADAGKGRGKAPRQRELFTRPGLPGSAEELLEC